ESVEFTAPIGTLYHEHKPIDFSSHSGSYQFKKEELELVGEVVIENVEGTHHSDDLFYKLSKGELLARVNVKSFFTDKETGDKMVLESSRMKVFETEERLSFKGNVKGKLERKRKYEKGYEFSANALEYLGKESFMELQGDVSLLRGNYYLQSERA